MEPQTNTEKKIPKVGVVIGSGGLKSLGSIELLAMLERENIPIDHLFGSSGGSLISGFYGALNSVQKVRDVIEFVTDWDGVMTQFDYVSLASMLGIPGVSFNTASGVLKPDLLIESFRAVLGNMRMEDMPRKVTLQATDMNSGEEIQLNTGNVAEAMYVSGALQPFLPPRMFNGRLLGDGAYTNPVPIMTAINAGMDIIIAIRFLEKSIQNHDLFTVFNDFIAKVVERHRRLQMMLAINMNYYEIITIPIYYDEIINIWDFHQVHDICQKTREVIETYRDEIVGAYQAF
jgi:NTE family protein